MLVKKCAILHLDLRNVLEETALQNTFMEHVSAEVTGCTVYVVTQVHHTNTTGVANIGYDIQPVTLMSVWENAMMLAMEAQYPFFLGEKYLKLNHVHVDAKRWVSIAINTN